MCTPTKCHFFCTKFLSLLVKGLLSKGPTPSSLRMLSLPTPTAQFLPILDKVWSQWPRQRHHLKRESCFASNCFLHNFGGDYHKIQISRHLVQVCSTNTCTAAGQYFQNIPSRTSPPLLPIYLTFSPSFVIFFLLSYTILLPPTQNNIYPDFR